MANHATFAGSKCSGFHRWLKIAATFPSPLRVEEVMTDLSPRCRARRRASQHRRPLRFIADAFAAGTERPRPLSSSSSSTGRSRRTIAGWGALRAIAGRP